jgi:hypothetical protein
MIKVNGRLQLINSNIERSRRLSFVLIITAALSVVELLYFLIYCIFKERDIIWFDFPGKERDLLYILFAIIAAPVFETWLNQALPYKLLNKVTYFKERSNLILFASAIFFGLLHFYSLFYLLYGFLMGIVLMYGYMVRIETDKNTFYLIAASHSLINLGVILINHFCNFY